MSIIIVITEKIIKSSYPHKIAKKITDYLCGWRSVVLKIRTEVIFYASTQYQKYNNVMSHWNYVIMYI